MRLREFAGGRQRGRCRIRSQTAGGVINVIQVRYERVPWSVSSLSDDSKLLPQTILRANLLTDFRREQFGERFGGPIRRTRHFSFRVRTLTSGSTEPTSAHNWVTHSLSYYCPVITANEALINGNPDCERQALLPSSRANRNSEEACRLAERSETTPACKIDVDITENNLLTCPTTSTFA